jgi:hypothetical protein
LNTQSSNLLKINKLSKAQFDRENNAANLDPAALYLTPEQPLIITLETGAEFTYDGSEAVGLDLASADHYHELSLSEDERLQSVDLDLKFGTLYQVTAGGSQFTFSTPTPPTPPSDTKVTQCAAITTNKNYPILLGNTDATTEVTNTVNKASTLKYNPNTKALTVTGGSVSAQSFTATSDKRLKENLSPYTASKSILDLPVYAYNFIADENKNTHIGCLAQDLQEICPEIVHTGDDGYLSINESKIVYLLLDEVKKLKAEVEELKASKV